MKRPNIVVFLSDQQRWDTCGCYGQPLETTPNLDRMAEQGTCFEHAFTCQPVCGPARACLQTGKVATQLGCHTNNRLLPPDEMTLAKSLSAVGYDTAYIGKWHLASFGPRNGENDFRTRAVPPERRGGYDFWLAADALEATSHSYDGYMYDGDGHRRDFPEGRYRADAQTDWVLEYLRGRKGDAPFFLFVSYIEPHHQNDHNHVEGPHGSKERFRDFHAPGDLVDLEGDWRAEYPDYLGCVNSLDQNLGRIRSELENLGLADNTLMIYTSDHGSHFRTRNDEYKRSCHESCLRVPLVLDGPGFRKGMRPAELANLLDLPPTILTAAGIAPPDGLYGRPLQDVVEGRVADWPDDVFVQISESQCGRAIRTNRWKYSVRAPDKTGQDPSSEVYVEDFLYDLDADPHECNNLVADDGLGEVRAELSQRLLRRMAQAGEAAARILPAPPPRI